MSVVVAFKFKDGVIIGADRRVTTSYHTYQENAVTKLHMTNYSNHVIGTVGYLRAVNIISTTDELMQYKDILDGVEVDKKYVINTIVPKMIEALDNGHMLDQTTYTSNSSFIYATYNRIFHIGIDFAVVEHPHWAAIGCGEEMIMGVMSLLEESTLEMNEEEAVSLMESCISYACKYDSAIGEEFDFIILKEDSFITNIQEFNGLNIEDGVEQCEHDKDDDTTEGSANSNTTNPESNEVSKDE